MKHKSQSMSPNFTCTDSRILYYKRQLRLANEALEDQKEEFTKKMKMFDDREKVLREKDFCLQESIVQSHEVIKDNEETKTKATKSISEERRKCEEIDQAISDLQTAMRRKKDEEQELIALLDQKLRYKQYLEEVVDYAKQQISSEDFADIQDILDRYSTLKSMNECLVSKMEFNMNEHDARRLSYAQFMKNSGNEILNMNNDVARLQKELEIVNVMADKMESLEFGTHQNSTEVMTDISQVLLAIDNMIERLQCHAHSSLSNKSRLPKISAMEDGIDKKVRMASERLDLIADLINDYDSILANTKTKGFIEEGRNLQ